MLGAAGERENFVGLLRELLELGGQAIQRLIERDEFFSVFFEELAAGVEGEAAFLCGQ